ncbi:hypothetical protein F5X68DRAFT_16484 [Plectosphaerella plurivora]|uniref:Zn(2)-C6 fungal-type domain-containing protein n=1 Tax=Plectosphaerella plurivora TaxID=936078 RepID=A0A9P9A9C8_9PEZI|nr:hypothetical protein F5X68DRAFT_16484 [Plectosphaerella plurivora]
MAEALLGLAPPGAIDAMSSKVPVSHADQLQDHLRRVLQIKSSPTRTEHVSFTFDIRLTVQFTIIEGDNDGAPPTDPALEGANAPPAAPTTRMVRVHDSVMNQPQDNPATQRAVAKHIIGLLSAVDNTTWVVRDISRGPQGWTFTYICKNSFASWAQQNAKNTAKPIIAEYSTKEPDPMTMNRPAFDCRGTVSIAFSKSSRSISVKFDHSPLHKTVGEMMETFQPPPRPVPVVVPPTPSAKTPRKTPKKRKSQAAAEVGEDGVPVEGAVDADGKPKKTPRKRKSQAGGTPADGQAPKRRKKKSTAAADGDATPTITNGQATQQQLDHGNLNDIFPDFSLNVTPTEAARRREIAIKLLSEGGVDPNTLSTEQLTIFSNQSPDLQKESLAMLAQYGAERLRIVHPHKSGAEATASQSPQPPETAYPAEPLTATPAAKKRSRKSKGAAADDSVVTDAILSTGKKPKLSRGACSLCRGSRTKCDKGKPSCGQCQAAGLDCQYPLEVSRAAKLAIAAKKSAETVPDESEDDENETEVAPEVEQTPEEVEEDEPDDIETIDYTSNMPVATMLTPAVDTSSHDYFNVTSGFPAAMVSNAEDHGIAPSSLNYPEPPASASGFGHSTAPVAAYSQPQTQPEATQTRQSKEGTGRRALPSGSSANAAASTTATSAAPSYTSSWQAANSEQVSRSSGGQHVAAKQHRSHGSVQEQQPAPAQDASSAYNSLINLTTLTNAALQQQSASPTIQPTQTVAPAQVSPFQAHAQTAISKSRPGQRAQTRTPLAEGRSTTPAHRVDQHSVPAPAAPAVDNTSYASATDISGNSGYNAYGTRYPNTTAEQDNSRLNYEPYAAQNAAAASSNNTTYSTQSTYGTRSSTGARANQSTQQQQASYPSATTATHGRKTPAHSASLANPPVASYADPMAISNRQTASQQSFNMRNTGSSNTAAAQSRTSFNQPEKSYNDYSGSSVRQQAAQQQQQQQSQPQQTQQSQQNWYGSYTGGNNSSSYGRGGNTYGGASNDSNSYQQQHQQQQHGQMNMANQGYGGGEGDYFDILRNMNNNQR